MKQIGRKWLLIFGLLLAAPAASASEYVVYVPKSMALGGVDGEVYIPQTFNAHRGLAGAALVDASMAELYRLIGNDAKAINVKVKGMNVLVSISGPRATHPDVNDRALGAVFHTLKLTGISKVMYGERALHTDNFSRGALLPVLPFSGAVPPRRLTHGYVLMSQVPMHPKDYYNHISIGSSVSRDALKHAFEMAPTEAKLALLEGLRSIRMRDTSRTLLPQLKDPDPRVRLAILEKLKDEKEQRILKAIERLVSSDPNTDVQSAAARILVGAGREEFKKYLLLDSLASTNADVVIEAAEELIQTNDAKLAAPLLDLVHHSNPNVRAMGKKAILHFQLYDVATKLLGNPEINQDVAEPLAQTLTDEASGSERAAGIQWFLQNGAPEAAIRAAGVAGVYRVAGATDALCASLKREEPKLRMASAKALAFLKDAVALEPLADAVRAAGTEEERNMLGQVSVDIISVQALEQVIRIGESKDAVIRGFAVKSLAEFAKQGANARDMRRILKVLRTHMKDKEDSIRQAAVYALARIDDRGVMKDLVALKTDRDPLVRQQVVHALGTFDHPDAEALLTAFLDDVDNRVKLRAVIAVREKNLTTAYDKIKWMVEYRNTDVRREVLRGILALGKPADPALFEVYQNRLYDEDADIKILAIEGLGAYDKDGRSALAIGGAVTDQTERVRIKAIETLARSTDPNAVEQVIRGLFDASVPVKLKALDALEALASPKSRKALQEFILNEPAGDVKKRASEVLDKI